LEGSIIACCDSTYTEKINCVEWTCQQDIAFVDVKLNDSSWAERIEHLNLWFVVEVELSGFLHHADPRLQGRRPSEDYRISRIEIGRRIPVDSVGRPGQQAPMLAVTIIGQARLDVIHHYNWFSPVFGRSTCVSLVGSCTSVPETCTIITGTCTCDVGTYATTVVRPQCVKTCYMTHSQCPSLKETIPRCDSEYRKSKLRRMHVTASARSLLSFG
jgi:hypothetical protein